MAESGAIDANQLENLPLSGVFEEDVSVEETQHHVQQNEYEQIVPNQFEHATLPHAKQMPKASKAFRCVLKIDPIISVSNVTFILTLYLFS